LRAFSLLFPPFFATCLVHKPYV